MHARTQTHVRTHTHLSRWWIDHFHREPSDACGRYENRNAPSQNSEAAIKVQRGEEGRVFAERLERACRRTPHSALLRSRVSRSAHSLELSFCKTLEPTVWPTRIAPSNRPTRIASSVRPTRKAPSTCPTRTSLPQICSTTVLSALSRFRPKNLREILT